MEMKPLRLRLQMQFKDPPEVVRKKALGRLSRSELGKKILAAYEKGYFVFTDQEVLAAAAKKALNKLDYPTLLNVGKKGNKSYPLNGVFPETQAIQNLMYLDEKFDLGEIRDFIRYFQIEVEKRIFAVIQGIEKVRENTDGAVEEMFAEKAAEGRRESGEDDVRILESNSTGPDKKHTRRPFKENVSIDGYDTFIESEGEIIALACSQVGKPMLHKGMQAEIRSRRLDDFKTGERVTIEGFLEPFHHGSLDHIIMISSSNGRTGRVKLEEIST